MVPDNEDLEDGTEGCIGQAGPDWTPSFVSTAATSAATDTEASRQTSESSQPESVMMTSAASEFIVHVDKTDGGMLGVDVGTSDGRHLLVRRVTAGGLMATWNGLNPDTRMEPGDSILEVNGVSSDAHAMLEECKKRQPLRLVLRHPDEPTANASPSEPAATPTTTPTVRQTAAPRRPAASMSMEFIVMLRRETGSERLGLDVDSSDGRSIVVEGVSEPGLVAEWNQQAARGRGVRTGDRIVAVNGISGDMPSMLAECREQATLRFVVRREAQESVTTAARAAHERAAALRAAAGLHRTELSEDSQLAWALAESRRLAGLAAEAPRPARPGREPLLPAHMDIEPPAPAPPRRVPVGPPPMAAEPPCADSECRFCLESSGPERLIAPCDCTGSMGYTHRSCLNEWRSHNLASNPKAMTHCPTCHVEYVLVSSAEDLERKRRRRYCFRVSRDSFLLFIILQALIFGVALAIREMDSGLVIPSFFRTAEDKTWVAAHWWKDFFQHELLHYYCASVLVWLFGLGVALVSILGVAFLCPYCLPRRAREPLAGLHGVALLSLSMAVLCGLAIVVVVLLGAFVALFVLSLCAQKIGQKYLEVAQLRDLAERFAVVDRVKGASGALGIEALDLERYGPGQEGLREQLREEIQAVTAADDG